MLHLLLHFRDTGLDEFGWALAGVPEASSLDWKSGNVSQLGVLLSQHALPVVFILPQQAVYFTRFEIPEKASRQVLASIEYQIEDQLAQDTELQHYSIGKQKDGKVPIVVVEQSIMQACKSLQQKYGIRVVQIIPELFLYPWSGEEGVVNIIENGDYLIIRYGLYRGLTCQRELLKPMLVMVNRECPIKTVDYYLSDEAGFEGLKVDKYESAFKPDTVTEFDPHSTDIINLQQRQYQASSNWIKIFQVWRGIAVLLVLLLGAGLFTRVMALQQMENDLNEIRVEQYELVKGHLAPDARPSDNLKKDIIKLLQQDNGGAQQLDFLGLLLEFSQAMAQYPSVQIIKIGYQKQRLSVDISSGELNDVEALHAALNARGLSTQLERLNIKPEIVSGQFVIEGGAND
ncbi:MAG: hypothetical protein GY820_15120 [Gammaproteobacteria bacterium]|nr:hypothetical protein [Gammaproteobacteria bacterium]